jgi:hypothetical protein
MLYNWIYRWLQTALMQYTSSKKPEETTKVIVVLNTDTVRTIQGVHNKDQLPTITIQDKDDEEEEKNPGRIALRMKHMNEANLSVIGHVDHNLLSFVMNVLLSHQLKSIVMLKKSEKSLEKIEDTEKQEIFVYEPPRAERDYLEGRF